MFGQYCAKKEFSFSPYLDGQKWGQWYHRGKFQNTSYSIHLRKGTMICRVASRARLTLGTSCIARPVTAVASIHPLSLSALPLSSQDSWSKRPAMRRQKRHRTSPDAETPALHHSTCRFWTQRAPSKRPGNILQCRKKAKNFQPVTS